MTAQTTPFEYPDPPEIDEGEIFRRAIESAFDLIHRSRTGKAATIRLSAARHVIRPSEKPAVICKRLKISRRRFFEVCQEIRRECGLPNPRSGYSVRTHRVRTQGA